MYSTAMPSVNYGGKYFWFYSTKITRLLICRILPEPPGQIGWRFGIVWTGRGFPFSVETAVLIYFKCPSVKTGLFFVLLLYIRVKNCTLFYVLLYIAIIFNTKDPSTGNFLLELSSWKPVSANFWFVLVLHFKLINSFCILSADFWMPVSKGKANNKSSLSTILKSWNPLSNFSQRKTTKWE